MLVLIMSIENNNDRGKAEKIYELYYGTMLYIANSILHENHIAEDAVSESFIKIINNLEKINTIDCYQTRGFVVIIVRNISLDMLRRQKRNKTTPLDDYNEYLECEETLFEDALFNDITVKEAREEIAASIAKLNKNYSDILYLKMNKEYTNDEIGKILGLSYGNVKVRLSRARKALKQELLKEGNLYVQQG